MFKKIDGRQEKYTLKKLILKRTPNRMQGKEALFLLSLCIRKTCVKYCRVYQTKVVMLTPEY